MILKFCVEEVKPVAEFKKPVKRFVRPTVEEVTAYMFERTNTQNFGTADRFCDFYESNGWKVGKNKMKDWKAAARNWLKGNSNERHQAPNKQLSALERVQQACAEQNRGNEFMPEFMGGNDGDVHGQVDEEKRPGANLDLDCGDFTVIE